MNKEAVFAAMAACLLSVAATQNSTELGGRARTIYVGADEPPHSDSFTECHLERAVRFCSTFWTEIEFNLPF